MKCHPQAPKAEPMVCNVQATTIEEVPIICEYPDVFPEELPAECHQIEIWNLSLTSYLEPLQ